MGKLMTDESSWWYLNTLSLSTQKESQPILLASWYDKMKDIYTGLPITQSCHISNKFIENIEDRSLLKDTTVMYSVNSRMCETWQNKGLDFLGY